MKSITQIFLLLAMYSIILSLIVISAVSMCCYNFDVKQVSTYFLVMSCILFVISPLYYIA